MILSINYEIDEVKEKVFFDENHVKHPFYECTVKNSDEVLTLDRELGEMLLQGVAVDCIDCFHYKAYVNGKYKRHKLGIVKEDEPKEQGLTNSIKY